MSRQGVWMAIAALGWAALAPDARAADKEGIPVTVRVLDAATGTPVPTAAVRHPGEQDRHRVNTESGAWTNNVMYMPDGSELLFEKGMTLEFEVSAPGYVNKRVSYVVRKRRNEVEVPLEKMALDTRSETSDEIGIRFRHDNPID